MCFRYGICLKKIFLQFCVCLILVGVRVVRVGQPTPDMRIYSVDMRYFRRYSHNNKSAVKNENKVAALFSVAYGQTHMNLSYNLVETVSVA